MYGNQTYLADYDSQKRIVHISSHLACFHGGNWLLGMYTHLLVIFSLIFIVQVVEC